MAQSQTSSSSSSAAAAAGTTRPWNGLWILAMAAMSVVGLYVMRIDGAITGYPVGFEDAVNAATFPDGRGPMQTRYLGFAEVDYVLRFIVTAFTPGAAAWDPAYVLHHLHFFFNFTAVLGIWLVEAHREGNREKLLSYTTGFAICYQTIGAAPFIPLWYLCHLLSSSPPSSSSSSAESLTSKSATTLPLPTARALLPATVLGYVLPTLCMYIPWAGKDKAAATDLTPSAIAFWQASPLYVEILLLVFSLAPGPDPANQWIRPEAAAAAAAASSSPPDQPLEAPREKRKEEEQEEKDKQVRGLLKAYYRALLAIGILAHAGVIYVAVASPSSPLVERAGGSMLGALARVFLPDPARKMESMAEGLHYIFQWDWAVVVVASLAWCWAGVLDVLRGLGGGGVGVGIGPTVKSAGLIVLLSVVLGPGATMALVWNWREDKLVVLEGRGSGKTKTL